jgi:DNA-binding IclR family transcriptional regulator
MSEREPVWAAKRFPTGFKNNAPGRRVAGYVKKGILQVSKRITRGAFAMAAPIVPRKESMASAIALTVAARRRAAPPMEPAASAAIF